LRAVASYLNHARTDAARASTDILRHSHAYLRDYYFERAEELLSTVQQGRTIATQAAKAADAGAPVAQRRTTESADDLARVRTLIDSADRIAAPAARRPG
jgi:hypothetical protein